MQEELNVKKSESSEECEADEILDYLEQTGIIDRGDVYEEMFAKKRKDIIAQCHTSKIWQCTTDGSWRTYVKNEKSPNGRQLIVKRTKKELEDFLVDFYQAISEEEEKKKITLRILYPQWLEHKSLSSASTYIIRINSDWKTHYLNSDIIDIPIQKLDKLTLETWALKLIKTHDPKTGEPCNMTKHQYYDATVIMRQALQFAVDLKIIERSPFDQVRIDGRRLFRKEKKPASSTQIFYEDEEKQLIQMAWDDFNNHVKTYELAPLALLMQFKTGMRIGEVVVLKFSDIETPGEIHVQRMIRRDTKEIVDHTKGTSEDRYIPLVPEAQELIESARERQKELNAENDYIFSITGEPIPEKSIASLYEKYCKKMGIINKSSHKSRKTFITTLFNSGMSLDTIRKIVGHVDPHTTEMNYVFDRATDSEILKLIEEALKID